MLCLDQVKLQCTVCTGGHATYFYMYVLKRGLPSCSNKLSLQISTGPLPSASIVKNNTRFDNRANRIIGRKERVVKAHARKETREEDTRVSSLVFAAPNHSPCYLSVCFVGWIKFSSLTNWNLVFSYKNHNCQGFLILYTTLTYPTKRIERPSFTDGS